MPVQIYAGGSWHSVSAIKIYTGGQWKTLNALKVQVSTVWKDAWSVSSLQAINSYSCGGYTPYYNYISRFVFANETVSKITAVLSSARFSEGPVYSSVAGYIAGGQTSSNIVKVIDKLTFSTEATGVLFATLGGVRRDVAGCSAASSGFFLGGYDGTNRLNTLETFNFSNELVSALSALPLYKSHSVGVSSSTKGYAPGGYLTGAVGGNPYVVFSNGTAGQTSSQLVNARYSAAGTFSDVKGYVAGGYVSQSSTEAMPFSNETWGLISATYTGQGPASGTSLTKGYFMGGSYSNACYSFTFSNEVNNYISAVMAYTNSYAVAVNYWSGSR